MHVNEDEWGSKRFLCEQGRFDKILVITKSLNTVYSFEWNVFIHLNNHLDWWVFQDFQLKCILFLWMRPTKNKNACKKVMLPFFLYKHPLFERLQHSAWNQNRLSIHFSNLLHFSMESNQIIFLLPCFKSLLFFVYFFW